jgi:hypothetical protein
MTTPIVTLDIEAIKARAEKAWFIAPGAVWFAAERHPEASSLLKEANPDAIILGGDLPPFAFGSAFAAVSEEAMARFWESVSPANVLALLSYVEQLRGALAFYRDGFTHYHRNGPTGLRHSKWKPTEVLLDDCGETARAALGAQP